jgi:Rad3-related DNA helicase
MKLCETVPDGIIVFFPSYSLIHRVIDRWKATHTWREIQQLKRIFVEPRTVDTFDNVLTSYIQSNSPYSKISLPTQTGGILFAVCRGKVSEGINVSDSASRCIAIIGLPYPSVVDPKIRMKQAHNDQMRTKGQNQLLPGKVWLLQHTVRAINQAAGRVIRHRKDYGAVILVDVRFRRSDIKLQLSHWLRSSNKCLERSITQITEDISKFFNYHKYREIPYPVHTS